MFLRTTAEGDYIFLAKDEVCQTKPHLSEKRSELFGKYSAYCGHITSVCSVFTGGSERLGQQHQR